MQGVLQGFGVVLILIAVGVGIAAFLPRKRDDIAKGLTPLIYYVTNPALMFILLSDTDLHTVVGVFTPLALLTAALTAALYAVFAWLVLKTPTTRLPSTAMATSYVNAGNIGVPLALYAVGSTSPVVSVLIAQLLVLAPIYLCIFALVAQRQHAPGTGSWKALTRTVSRSIANPVTVATFAGALCALFNVRLPEVIHAPIEMLGHSSIAMLLVAFGMSLYLQRPLSDSALRTEIYVATAFKVLLMPLLAWAIARFIFGLTGIDLLGVVIMAALPTAQNVMLFSQQFNQNPTTPREVILLSTLLTFPVVLVATLLLG